MILRECRTVDSDDFAEDDTDASAPNHPGTQLVRTYEMRFLVLILGARTPPPRIDAPVMKIPLSC